MWSYHHYMGVSVLLRDRNTNELRTVHIDDRDEFRDLDILDKCIDDTVAREASETEDLVDVIQFAFDEDNPTTLKCPRCSEWLYWRFTGMS
jgi:hypothetical protein